MRTFSSYQAAKQCAIDAFRHTGRKARVRKVACYGTRKPWIVSEVYL